MTTDSQIRAGDWQRIYDPSEGKAERWYINGVRQAGPPGPATQAAHDPRC